MATMDDFDYLNESCKASFYRVFDRQEIEYKEIEDTANSYISHALTLYLNLPTAYSYSPQWIPSQYDVFGNRVCEIVRKEGRRNTFVSDLIEAIQRCGIIFVCAPPGPNPEDDRNG